MSLEIVFEITRIEVETVFAPPRRLRSRRFIVGPPRPAEFARDCEDVTRDVVVSVAAADLSRVCSCGQATGN